MLACFPSGNIHSFFAMFFVNWGERMCSFDQPGAQLQYEERYKILLSVLDANHPFLESAVIFIFQKILLTFVEMMGYRNRCLESTKLSTYVNSIIKEGMRPNFFIYFLLFLVSRILINNLTRGRGGNNAKNQISICLRSFQ